MPISTDERLYDLMTPLGEDALLVQAMNGRERISQPFEFQLMLASEHEDIKPEDLLGQRASLRVYTREDERHWTGLIASFERMSETRETDADTEITRYQCLIVPWFWFLRHHEDSRIFQDMSIPKIVETVFQDFGFGDYEIQLSGDYPDLVYCTQYRETSFNFVSRLLERAGIHYFFRHEEDVDIMVLTDNHAHNPMLEPSSVRFHDQILLEDEDGISALHRRLAVRTGRFVATDYDFTRPSTDLQVSINSLIQAGNNADYERYHHPGGYTEREEGEQLTRVQMEAEEADYETLDGASNVRAMTSGHAFELYDHPVSEMNEKYLIIAVEHKGTNNLGESGADTASTYSNKLLIMPLRVVYRAPLTTPRTRVQGPQTAVVTGPKGEEIYSDEYGRIKVHFFWDRRSGRNDKSSCWLRVAQIWAGRQWGAMFIPRIGQEVIVDFLDGDPDSPIVVGSVYNGENMPPYALPAEQTKSTIKTMSSKGGEGFNEIRFEDKKGEEQIFIHAQHDSDLRIRNDSRNNVGQDMHRTIGNDFINEMGRDRHDTIKHDRIAHIVNEDHLRIDGQQAIVVGGTQSVEVQDAVGESYKSHIENVQQSYTLKAGMNVVIEAGVQLSLKVGGSFIDISASGIAIKGPMVMINSGGGPASAESGKMSSPLKPLKPTAATTAEPGTLPKSGGDSKEKSHDPASKEAQDKTHMIEIELKDEDGQPVAGERVKVKLPNGRIARKTTNKQGLAVIKNIDPGNCEISFPGLDDKAWE